MRWLVLLWILLAHTSCETEQEFQDTLRLNLAQNPTSLDPREMCTLRELSLAKQLYEGLTRGDELGIAKSIDISEDGLTYTFHLRESYWSNGDPLFADAFEKSWKEILDPSNRIRYAHLLFSLKNGCNAYRGICPLDEVGVKAVDQHTLVVTLEFPTPYLLQLVGFPTLFPTHPEPGIFNGPFGVVAYCPGDRLHLQKNPLYWDSEEVALDRIHFSIIEESHTEALLFEAGELDWLGHPMSHPLSAELSDHFATESYPVAGTSWFVFNTKKAPFNDLETRVKFAKTLERQEIITHIFRGNQELATSILPPSMRLVEKLPLQQVAQSSRKEPLPKLRLLYSSSNKNAAEGDIVQFARERWKNALGVEIELVGQERHLYLRSLAAGDFELALGNWIADFNDPLSMLAVFSSSSEVKLIPWQSERFDQLIEGAKKELNLGVRDALLLEAETLLIEQMPVIPLRHYTFSYVKKPCVKGVAISPQGIADFKRARK